MIFFVSFLLEFFFAYLEQDLLSWLDSKISTKIKRGVINLSLFASLFSNLVELFLC